MSDWTFFQWAAAILGGLFILFVAARLVSAAYFLSKRDHETSAAQREFDDIKHAVENDLKQAKKGLK